MRFKPLWIPFLFAVLVGSLLVGLGPQRQEAASGKTPVTARPSLASYGKLPLSFELNQGQADRRVKFLSRGSGYALFLTPTEAVLAFRGPSEISVPEVSDANAQTNEGWKQELSALSFRPVLITKGSQTHAARSQSGAVLRMVLVGANPAAKVEGLDELPGKSNYFIGNDPKKWRTNVPNYGRVKVHDVYPGVDLMYYGNQRQLEGDFVVAPGADPRAITMAIAGAKKVSIDAQGELVLANPGGEVHLRKPVVYQRAGGVHHEITGGYKLKGENRVGFELGEYDARQPLVIDPVLLVYSTYLGGRGGERGFGIAVDSFGSAYVTGVTGSVDFPTTTGAFQTTSGGTNGNAFVTKLDATGSALVYSTFLGGSGGDGGSGIAVDSIGSAYVTGNTTSTNFPTTTSAFQTTSGGGFDAFVTKLDATGSALVYSTYLGGSANDAASGIAVDSGGNAYVTGLTDSTNFPTTSSAFQTANVGSFDAFVTKLNAAGSGLVYSTYLGGSGGGNGAGIAVDSSGSAYVTGGTSSTNFPTTSGAFQTSYSGCCVAFVTKLNAAGSALVYSTLLGGSNSDNGTGIALDSTGSAYVTGYAGSTDFPTTSGAFQTTFSGVADAFVTKLNATGSALVYSTYLGGSSKAQGFGIAVDSIGSAYVTGNTTSTDFPTTPDAFQRTFGGGGPEGDVVVTKLNTAGSALVYSSFLGGSRGQEGSGIAVDSAGSAYLTGRTFSTDFPTTSGAFQTTAGGAFVAKIAEANTPAGTNVAVQPTDTATGTAPATLTFSSVTQVGFTNLATSSSGPTPPAGFGLGSPATYYSLTTTATFAGPITVCINYAGISFGSTPQLFHFEGGSWVDVTTSVDTVNQIVCGSVTSLSPFALFQPTISGLMALVNSFNLPHGTANSLLAKLSNAQASFASGNLTAACNQLNAFINDVKAQSGKKITANQANRLIVAANGVKAGLGCS